MEPNKQSTKLVLLFGYVENPSNLTTSKLITKLNFNKKSCEKIFSSNNRLRLNFNGEKSKQWKRGQDAIRRNQSKIGMTSESVPGRKVGKKTSMNEGGTRATMAFCRTRRLFWPKRRGLEEFIEIEGKNKLS